MATHAINIHENTGATKAKAPYTGTYIERDTLDFDALAEGIGTAAGLSPIQARAIIEGEFEEIIKLENEGLVRVCFEDFSIGAVIKGSFATSDAAFDASKNKLQLALHLSDRITNSLVNETPKIMATSAKRVDINAVSDIASPRPYGIIYGTKSFLVHGYNLVLSDEGASIYLEGKNGTVYEVVVDEATDPQKIKAHIATNLEPGDYKLTIKSRGGEAEGPLQTRKRNIKYIQIPETMKITNIVDVEQEEGVVDVVTKGTRINMYGDNLGPFEWEQGTSLLMNATLTVTYTDTNDETQTQDILIDAMKSATQQGGGAYLAIGAGESLWQDRVKAGTRPTITFTHVIDGVTHRASRSFALVG